MKKDKDLDVLLLIFGIIFILDYFATNVIYDLLYGIVLLIYYFRILKYRYDS